MDFGIVSGPALAATLGAAAEGAGTAGLAGGLGTGLAAAGTGSALGAGAGLAGASIGADALASSMFAPALASVPGSVGGAALEGSMFGSGLGGGTLASTLGGGSPIVSAPPMPYQSLPIQPSAPLPPNAPPPQPGFFAKMGTQLSDPNKMADQLMSMPGMLTQKLLGGGKQAPVQFAPAPPSQPMGARMQAPQQLGGVVNVAPQGQGQGGLSLEQIMMLRRLGVM